MKTWWVSGEWNAICDQCGRKFKNTMLRKRWDGLMVCAEDYETRHPQEFVRAVKDNHPLPWTRPDRDLNADGSPRLTQGPTFNCSGATLRVYNPVFVADTIIAKGEVTGPMIIESGATITVLCTLTVM